MSSQHTYRAVENRVRRRQAVTDIDRLSRVPDFQLSKLPALPRSLLKQRLKHAGRKDRPRLYCYATSISGAQQEKLFCSVKPRYVKGMKASPPDEARYENSSHREQP